MAYITLLIGRSERKKYRDRDKERTKDIYIYIEKERVIGPLSAYNAYGVCTGWGWTGGVVRG